MLYPRDLSLEGIKRLCQADLTWKLVPLYDCPGEELRAGINGLVSDGNKKLCFRGFILALSQTTTTKKMILNIHKIIRGYSWYAKLKYYKLQ